FIRPDPCEISPHHTANIQSAPPPTGNTFNISRSAPLRIAIQAMVSIVNADPTWLQGQLMDGLASYQFERSKIALTLVALVLVPVIASYSISSRKDGKIPLLNPRGLFELSLTKNVEFMAIGMGLFQEGKKRFPGQPFKLLSNVGPVTILPPDRANEVKSLPTLNFRKAFAYALPAGCPGRDVFWLLDHPNEIVQKVVMKHLTKRLNSVTGPMALEAAFAIDKVLGNNPDWTEVIIYEKTTQIVARVSSRVFLGSQICRNEEWLDVTIKNAMVSFGILMSVRCFPSWLRSVIFWTGKPGKEFRALYARACNIVEPVVESRRRERKECAAKGLEPPVYNDVIEWVDMEAKGDPTCKTTGVQLVLSTAAIHTTADLFTYTLIQLAANPYHIEALRKEILETLPVNGWKKMSLASLKLLDSAIKEAQRLKPVQANSMQRMVTEDTELEGGYVLRKGEVVSVDASRVWDPARFENPREFNPYRFFEARQKPGGENISQLVSATADHLPFGYGKYACPGRFFVAHEIKLIFCYLLLKYDWKISDSNTAPFTIDAVANISQAGILQGLGTMTSAWYAPYIVTALVLTIAAYNSRDNYPNVPWLNPKGFIDLMAFKPRYKFFFQPRETLKEGAKRFGDKPYKLNTEHGPVLVLPHKYVAEVRSERNLDFTAAAGDPLSLEATKALKDVFAESKDWTEITPASVTMIVSRMSSRIFMEELCKDTDWIKASSEYVVNIFHFGFLLGVCPKFLRRIVNQFHPRALKNRQLLQNCRDILKPYLDQRAAVIKEAEAQGEKNPYNDSIEWYKKEVQSRKVDPAVEQISLSLLAVHTTSDLLGQTIVDIARQPELFDPLRQEVINVLGTDGLNKAAFQKLVLMDGCFKETQRVRPIFNTFFQRKALQNVTLSDGFVIRKGTNVAVDAIRMEDENIWPEPHRYNPYRFIEMRKTPGEEAKSHLVSVSANHFAFGHGVHACPGRFFAAVELKIALAHILLKYDWKLAPGSENIGPAAHGINFNLNPDIKLLVRRRKEELELDSLAF
ncbi:uncharacterized protein PpBr36_10642, partial [Pyricularia pennisetigena]|uniref:uncharacterized protein n=1 Tax=Pyricularia pennisetigena TaxID=1578925 RepID=UPI0011549DA5